MYICMKLNMHFHGSNRFFLIIELRGLYNCHQMLEKISNQ